MARYEFEVDIPAYIPQEAIEELKDDIKKYMDYLATECMQYDINVKIIPVKGTGNEARNEKEEEET